MIHEHVRRRRRRLMSLDGPGSFTRDSSFALDWIHKLLPSWMNTQSSCYISGIISLHNSQPRPVRQEKSRERAGEWKARRERATWKVKGRFDLASDEGGWAAKIVALIERENILRHQPTVVEAAWAIGMSFSLKATNLICRRLHRRGLRTWRLAGRCGSSAICWWWARRKWFRCSPSFRRCRTFSTSSWHSRPRTTFLRDTAKRMIVSRGVEAGVLSLYWPDKYWTWPLFTPLSLRNREIDA